MASAPGLDVAAMLQCFRHRGPDAEGQFSDERLWLGHVRLSVIDVSEAGNQPMETQDARYVISYNGEVYNFVELAKTLGLTDLRSHSDTEVVLRSFEKLGSACFELFNGLFAFAIYDTDKKKLWLVRDRLGIKPLYFTAGPHGFAFASEIRALPRFDDTQFECNLSAVHEWLYYGTTLGDKTLFSGIEKLLPGHYLELDVTDLSYRILTYWTPASFAREKKDDRPSMQIVAETRRLLEQAVSRQLVSDVPVGVFLSGGVDSSAITAFASRHYEGKLATYSVGFDFDDVNELPKAKAVAKLYGTDHHEIHVSGADIADVVVKMVAHHGMPFSDAANIPLYLLSERVQGTTKVVLQGDGGDEMFGGYNRYSILSFYRSSKMIARGARLAMKLAPRGPRFHRRERLANALLPKDPAEVMALLLTEEDPFTKPGALFAPDFRRQIESADPFARYREVQAQFSGEDLVNQMLFVDSMIILPDIFLEKVDRSTMAASVEVRVPFLDNDLVDFCMRLSGPQKVRYGRKKWLLKKALEGIVPREVLYGRKTGFGVPYGEWLRGSLRPLFMDNLQLFGRNYPRVLDAAAVEAAFNAHSSRGRDRSFLLWKILNFTIWANTSKVTFGQ